MDITTFINTLKMARTRWQELLAQIDQGRMLQPGVTGKWSIKDIIAHIMWSEREMIPVMQTHTLAGSELWNISQDERNEAVYQQYKTVPLLTILTEEQQTYDEFLATVQTLTDADLHDPHNFKAMPTEWLPWQVLAGGSFRHYEDHIPSIRAWLATS